MSRSNREGKQGSVRHVAHRILRRVEEGGAYASILIEKYLPTIADPRDGALLHEIVLGVLRRRSVLDHVLGQAASRAAHRQDPAVRAALRVGAYTLIYLDRVPDHAAVNSAVEVVKQDGAVSAAGFVNGVLRHVARNREALLPAIPRQGDVGALALAEGHPQWWVSRLVDRMGWRESERLLRANNEPAGAVLLVNRRRITPGDLADRLREESVQVEPGKFVPDSLRVISGRAAGTGAFREGLFYFQDEASQLVPLLFGDLEGGVFVDLCAAPGGKALQVAQQLPRDGMVVALDRHPGRVRLLRRNAQRMGENGILAVVGDAAPGRTCLKGPFGHVLLDAPCSGTGTFRRHPEIRWRLQEKDITRLATRQSSMLENACGLVESGGSLVYSVCSMEPEEGELAVRSFLDSHPEFKVVDPRDRLPEASRAMVASDGSVRTSPADGPLDGFFAVLLERKGRQDRS